MPDKVIVTIVSGTPGAIAIMGDDGIPFTIRPLPNINRGKLFDRDSMLTQTLHVFPSVSAIAKIVIAPGGQALGSGDDDYRIFSRSGVGYFYHLLRWLEIPTIIATPGWLSQYAAQYGGRSALGIVQHEFPNFFDEAYASEECARAAILGFIAVTNPDWKGISFERSPVSDASTHSSSLH
jgi:hypothetical protein